MDDNTCKKRLEEDCIKIVNFLAKEDFGKNEWDGDDYTAWDYINDALDIHYVVGRDGRYLGARLLLAYGGPTIWLDTYKSEVTGSWGFTTKVTVPFRIDNLGLDDALEEQAEILIK